MMELILWRHAEAEDTDPKGDLARALTKKGRKQANAMADWLRPRLTGEWTILSSPAARAIQTVASLDMPYEVRPRLGPAHDASDMLRESGWPNAGRVIVVGHQPTLGEVASHLMGGAGEIAFRKGAIWWCATRERDGRMEALLRTVLDPDALDAG